MYSKETWDHIVRTWNDPDYKFRTAEQALLWAINAEEVLNGHLVVAFFNVMLKNVS